MSVYIVDNGGSYSDRKIWFVEPTAEEAPLLEELVAAFGRAWPRDLCRRCKSTEADQKHHSRYETFHLIAKVHEADWFRGRASLRDLTEAMELQIRDECEDVEAAALCFTRCKQILDPKGEGYWDKHDFSLPERGECKPWR